MTMFAAGYKRAADGSYVRDPVSNGCGGIDDGCLWAPMLVKDCYGTSCATPNVTAALASVLSVFPDTTPQNLLKLTKACARKTGDGIEKLLRVSGGIGVADFTCLVEITAAARALPAGGSTTVTVDGSGVTVTERELSVRY